MKVVLSRQRDCFGAGGLVGLVVVVVEEVQEGGLGGRGLSRVRGVAVAKGKKKRVGNLKFLLKN